MEWGGWHAWSAQDVWSCCFLALIVAAVLTPARLEPAAICRKLGLSLFGIAYLGVSRDSHFQLPPDPGKSCAVTLAKKRIVFVRHGESTWNECFNRSFNIFFPLRLMWVLVREAMMLLCSGSLLFDSPLSQEGLAQARVLEQFVESEQGEEFRRLCEAAVFVSSCLRRAAATGSVALGRYFGGDRPMWYLSSLQEISRNVDTLALARPYCPPELRSCEQPTVTNSRSAASGSSGAASAGTAAARTRSSSYNTGNKGLTSHGAKRLQEFCDWVFSPCSPAALQPNVIVSGHSLWFKTFFQVYLPHTAYHECKHAKIVNCGVIMFDLECLQSECGRPEYRIVQDSVVTLYGGFEQKKKRKYWTRSRKKD